MASPTEFTLNADVFRLIADTADVGADEDMPAITGLQLYFDADLVDADRLIPANISPRPIFIKPERVTGYIRSNGRMYDQPSVSAVPADITDPGNVGVRLLASGAELGLVSPLTYTVSSNQVTIGGVLWGVEPWHIPAPTTDVTVDLASFAPVSAGSGTTITRGPAGPGADAVRLSGGNVIFSYQGVDIPAPLAIASASVPDGSVTTVKIVDANVTLPKLSAGVQTSLGLANTALQSLATDSVGSAQIAAGAVTASELADNSVDTAAIINANVTLTKLAATVQTSLGKADTALQLVNTAAIVDANVTLPKLSATVQTSLGKADTALQSLAVDSVGSSQIAANAVGPSELADNSVDTAAIIDANVSLPKLSAGVQTSLGKADTALQSASTVAGDLSGTAGAPTVAKVNGVAVTGTPSVGWVPTAVSASAATWQAQAGGGGGMTDPLTTAGDIIVRGASATIRKAVGANTQVLRVNTANADKLEYATLTKTDVGLANIDNTSDVNKPVSTAQAAANATVLASSRAFAFALSLLFRQG